MSKDGSAVPEGTLRFLVIEPSVKTLGYCQQKKAVNRYLGTNANGSPSKRMDSWQPLRQHPSAHRRSVPHRARKRAS